MSSSANAGKDSFSGRKDPVSMRRERGGESHSAGEAKGRPVKKSSPVRGRDVSTLAAATSVIDSEGKGWPGVSWESDEKKVTRALSGEFPVGGRSCTGSGATFRWRAF